MLKMFTKCFSFQMIERVIGADFTQLCVTEGSVLDILGVPATPAFIEWERGLCALNWTEVAQELETSNNKAYAFMTKVDSFEPPQCWVHPHVN